MFLCSYGSRLRILPQHSFPQIWDAIPIATTEHDPDIRPLTETVTSHHRLFEKLGQSIITLIDINAATLYKFQEHCSNIRIVWAWGSYKLLTLEGSVGWHHPVCQPRELSLVFSEFLKVGTPSTKILKSMCAVFLLAFPIGASIYIHFIRFWHQRK